MPYNPQRARPIRIPCPVVDDSHSFGGLYFTENALEALPVDVITIFPPVENALSKRFPIFEGILGTAQPIHECLVQVQRHGKQYRFLVAYQTRPHSALNQSLSMLAPGVQVRGEILVVRSGKTVLVQAMGGKGALEAATVAVRKFVEEMGAHFARHRRKRTVPPLPTQLFVE
ncbi:hypothetical protein C8Q76DRAFT_769206 [Earliella scabrosa]|nr:hypothetical protein C8Q76DRAFT_769206 [Earliella scabrosa]